MTCKLVDEKELQKLLADKKIALIPAPLSDAAFNCLRLIGGPWCYGTRRGDAYLVAVDTRFLQEAEEALRQCVERLQHDLHLAKTLTNKTPDQFEKEYHQLLKLLGEANAIATAIDDLLDKSYQLAEIELTPKEFEKLAKELRRINPEIKVDDALWSIGIPTNKATTLIFSHRDKELTIGKATLDELLQSAEFVATEEKALNDILTAARKALPKKAKKLEEAVEKLKLFKKMLDLVSADAESPHHPRQEISETDKQEKPTSLK